jgi:hypothetical protein
MARDVRSLGRSLAVQRLRQMLSSALRFIGDILFMLAGTLLAVALILAAIAGGLEAWVWFGRAPLVRDIPPGVFLGGVGIPKMASTFRDRIKSTFPIGMPESDLVHRLRSEGFTDPRTFNGEQYAYFRTGSLVCVDMWTVIWRTDEAGAVREIRGDLQGKCHNVSAKRKRVE